MNVKPYLYGGLALALVLVLSVYSPGAAIGILGIIFFLLLVNKTPTIQKFLQ